MCGLLISKLPAAGWLSDIKGLLENHGLCMIRQSSFLPVCSQWGRGLGCLISSKSNIVVLRMYCRVVSYGEVGVGEWTEAGIC
jgi:hypothetical protein